MSHQFFICRAKVKEHMSVKQLLSFSSQPVLEFFNSAFSIDPSPSLIPSILELFFTSSGFAVVDCCESML